MSFCLKRDDLHLSRIMLQQDLYNQQQYSDNGLVHSYSNEQLMATSDTMKDANETLSKSFIVDFSFSLKRII